MPTCAAPNCTMSGRKGARLFQFPASPTRRARWIENTRRDNWLPTKFSKLCENHFDFTQYETLNVEGKKKLRKTAIPTIFNVHQKVRKSTDKPADINYIDHNYSKLPTVPSSWDIQPEEEVILILHDLPITYEKVSPILHDLPITNEKVSTDSPNSHENNNENENVSELPFEEMVCGKDSLILSQRRKIWRLQKEITKLKKDKRKLQSLEKHIPFFSMKLPDLSTTKVRRKLSSRLMQEARQVRTVLGYRGYKYLADKGLPLISKCNVRHKFIFYRLPSPETLKTL